MSKKNIKLDPVAILRGKGKAEGFITIKDFKMAFPDNTPAAEKFIVECQSNDIDIVGDDDFVEYTISSEDALDALEFNPEEASADIVKALEDEYNAAKVKT